MQLRQLRHFLAVIEEGSFNQAALRQNVTQPALTRSVQKLEESLQVQLLDRSRSGVELTTYGKVFAEHARRITAVAAHASADIAAMRTGRQGEVRLGIGSSAVQEWIGICLSEACSAAEDLSLSIDYGEVAALTAKLRRGELDAVISLWRGGLDNSGLHFQDIGSVQLVVVARAGHPFAKRKGMTRADLASVPWAIYDTPTAETFYGKVLGISPSESPIRIRCAIPSMLRYIVLGGDFLTLAKVADIAHDLTSGAMVEIDSELPPINLPLLLITRTNASATTALRITLDRLRQAVR